MKSANFRLILLAFLLAAALSLPSCQQHKQTDPARKNLPIVLHDTISSEQFQALLNQLPTEKTVLADERYRDRLPSQVKVQRFDDLQYRQGHWRIPDKRYNPADADYILALYSHYLRAILAEPSWWTIKAATKIDEGLALTLLERKAVEAAFEPPLSAEAFAQAMDNMVRIKWKRGECKRVGCSGKAFLIDRYETTHAQYAHFLNEIGIAYDETIVYYNVKDPASRISYVDGSYRVHRGAGDLPVYNVSWYGANAFCRHYNKRLPQNIEWSKAAGFFDGDMYPWGDGDDVRKRANLLGAEDGYDFWAPVGSFPEGVSRYGVYNLGGNACEWIELGKVRGGSIEHKPAASRNDVEDANERLARNLHDGFRCAQDE